MGYPWRKTLGYLDCRPKEYRSEIFPKPASQCSKFCIYYVFCELEVNHMTLGERLKEIKLILQKPYHFFTRSTNGKQVILYLEGVDGSKKEFVGNNIAETIERAEIYIEHEKKMGTLRAPESSRGSKK